jgi:Uma2 family endonuclease
MAFVILDPVFEARLREEWLSEEDEKRTEVWEGVTVMPPIANDEHFDIAGQLYFVFCLTIQMEGLGVARTSINLSDRHPNWTFNYRNPDAVVFLKSNKAKNYSTHWVGGPDFVVEIISPGEDPTAKLPFYESVKTQEVMLVHRDPWKLDLYALQDGKLTLVGQSDLVTSAILPSALGLTFQLVDGAPRPQIHVTQPSTSLAWTL